MITFGKNNQVNCSEDTYYEFLGYISNHPDAIKIVFENNQDSGAWGNEGRIQFYNDIAQQHFNQGFKFTAGVGNVSYRLNCNDLISAMLSLGFVMGQTQDCAAIRGNIPVNQQANYDSGVNL